MPDGYCFLSAFILKNETLKDHSVLIFIQRVILVCWHKSAVVQSLKAEMRVNFQQIKNLNLGVTHSGTLTLLLLLWCTALTFSYVARIVAFKVQYRIKILYNHASHQTPQMQFSCVALTGKSCALNLFRLEENHAVWHIVPKVRSQSFLQPLLCSVNRPSCRAHRQGSY